MQHWLDSMGYARRYGNFNIGNNLDTFWLDNSAKVTADEQLGLVKKLYFDQLPFLNRNQELVKGMMLWENNSNYKLSYKTGWGYSDSKHSIGWIVGWIEENKHPYFFSLMLDSPDINYDMKSVRLKMLKDILKQYGFFEGRK
jgi:beta-lactamase class D